MARIHIQVDTNGLPVQPIDATIHNGSVALGEQIRHEFDIAFGAERVAVKVEVPDYKKVPQMLDQDADQGAS